MSELVSLKDRCGTWFFSLFMSVFLLQCGTDHQPAKERHIETPPPTPPPPPLINGETKKKPRRHVPGWHHSFSSNRLNFKKSLELSQFPLAAASQQWLLGKWEEVTSVLRLGLASHSPAKEC